MPFLSSQSHPSRSGRAVSKLDQKKPHQTKGMSEKQEKDGEYRNLGREEGSIDEAGRE